LGLGSISSRGVPVLPHSLSQDSLGK
jgi:hypothetical protein